MRTQRAYDLTDSLFGPAPPPRSTPRLAGEGDVGASPALRLREELAQRLAETPATFPLVEHKLPVPARLAVIAVLSLACWSAIGFAVTRLF